MGGLEGLGAVLLALGGGCKKKTETGSEGAASGSAPGKKQSIQNIGSDTMVNLATAWAEAYGKVDKSVSVEVNGGGSGTGVTQLIAGNAQIANCSRTYSICTRTTFSGP